MRRLIPMPDNPDAIPLVDRTLSVEDGIEQFAIQVDHWLRLQGQPPCDDGAVILLMEHGYTPEGAASVIIAGRR